MVRNLPPLNSLRAFECAARHMSFTLASRELNVTPAAVSQQVKSLEYHLGIDLFTRLTRKLVLTPAGESLLPGVSQALDALSDAVDAVNENHSNERLTLRLGPTLAALWLSPRLHLFWEQQPHVDLCLYHSSSPVDFNREDIDLAITFGSGSWKGVESAKLFHIDFFPICSPGLLKRSGGREGLLRQTLLHDTRHDEWREWLGQGGYTTINARRGIVIDDTNVLIQAALDGQGVALGSTLFVRDHLENGRLVRPYSRGLQTEQAYYVVCPKRHLLRPSVRTFRDWLLDQGRQQEAGIGNQH